MDGRAQEVVEKLHVAPPPAASAKMPNEITMCRVCFLHRQSACIDPALVCILLVPAWRSCTLSTWLPMSTRSAPRSGWRHGFPGCF